MRICFLGYFLGANRIVCAFTLFRKQFFTKILAFFAPLSTPIKLTYWVVEVFLAPLISRCTQWPVASKQIFVNTCSPLIRVFCLYEIVAKRLFDSYWEQFKLYSRLNFFKMTNTVPLICRRFWSARFHLSLLKPPVSNHEISEMPDAGAEICPGRFAWECDSESCCDSYHMRVMMLFFSVGIFLVALIVLIVWLAIDYRPSRR